MRFNDRKRRKDDERAKQAIKHRECKGMVNVPVNEEHLDQQ